jgi:hypothetical protein
MKKLNNTVNTETTLKQVIKQPNQKIKSLMNTLLLLGSLGFFITGLSSYYNTNFVSLLDTSKILFFPQGITMTIYGFFGIILSINQILILYYGIGEGFNEFNSKTGKFKILRKNSYSGKVELIYSLDDIVRDINLRTKIQKAKKKTLNFSIKNKEIY